jgi:hypothetical protein
MEECEPRQCSGHELLSPAHYKDLMSYIAIASGGFVWHLGLACSEYGVSLAMLRYRFNVTGCGRTTEPSPAGATIVQIVWDQIMKSAIDFPDVQQFSGTRLWQDRTLVEDNLIGL